MKKYNKSIRRIKEQKNREICAKMRKRKAEMRVERATPSEATERENRHAFTFYVKDQRTGNTVHMECYEGTTLRSYWVKEIGKGWRRKQMGKTEIHNYLKSEFPNTGRFE